jgi:hypothetical protein
MSKFPIMFTDVEGLIVNTLWLGPKDSHSTYSLVLNRDIAINTPDGDRAFEATQEAVERLYELGLLRGDRLKDAAGRIYFANLKLTTKGEQETIRYRKDQVKLKQELADVIESSRQGTEETERSDEKNKNR